MRRTLLPLALAATVLAACGGTSSSSDSTAQSAQPSAPAITSTPADTAAPTDSGPAATGAGSDTTAPPAAAAPEALQFAAPLVGGGTIDFTQFAGKTVALWFWAPT